MSEMVERVCRAICIADGVDPDAEGFGMGIQMPEGEPYPLWRAREKQARAAIAAMREPTEAMNQQAANLHTHESACATDYGVDADPQAMKRLWQAMIDEAAK